MSAPDRLIASLRKKDPVRVLFVCLGNICRSPAAEGVARAIAREKGRDAHFDFDSAGTYGGHAGQLPDPRMRSHAARRGYNLTHRSRPVRPYDLQDFDLIIAMDDSNYETLYDMAPTVDDAQRIVRMTDFCTRFPGARYVPDPYYEGADGFELVLDMLEDACAGLIETL